MSFKVSFQTITRWRRASIYGKPFALKKTKPKSKKIKKTLTFNKDNNKNEATNILGFSAIWISL